MSSGLDPPTSRFATGCLTIWTTSLNILSRLYLLCGVGRVHKIDLKNLVSLIFKPSTLIFAYKRITIWTASINI